MHELSTQKSSGDGLSHYRVKNHLGVEEKELLRSCQRVSWVFSEWWRFLWAVAQSQLEFGAELWWGLWGGR